MRKPIRGARRAPAVIQLFAAILLAAGPGMPAHAQGTGGQPRVTETGEPGEAAIRARADALIAQMTPEEKAGQLSQYFYIGALPPLRQLVEGRLAQGQVGSLLMVSDPAEANRLQRLAVEQSRLHIPILFGFDVIHGLNTIFPVPIGMAASWDPAMVERAQGIAASEARAVGIHWAFAPNVDMGRDPRWGRIVEGAGEDPYLGAAMARAQVRGFQGPALGTPGRIMAGPKHFAGYGASIGGRDYDQVEVSDSELWNIHLPPFRAAIEAGAGNVMSAYMPLNGVPAAGNRWLLTDVLRRDLGFRGFVVSDAGSVRSLIDQGMAADPSGAAVQALRSGLDMEMARIPQPAVMETIPEALRAGRISQTELDDAVRRVLIAKIRLGLFEHPYVDEARSAERLGTRASRSEARVAAERSAVLLRNDGDLLPLDRNAVRSLAVIGPLADSRRDLLGPWVMRPQPVVSPSILEAIRAAVPQGVRVTTAEGVRIPQRVNPSQFAMLDRMLGVPMPSREPIDEAAAIQEAVRTASAADVAVLVLGESQDMIGEMASRSSFELPGRQRALLDAVVATGKPVVVVLLAGRPLDVGSSQARAILNIWYPGSEGGPAVANLLFGAANPAGRLPFTWIANAAQAPMTYDRLLSHDNANAERRYQNETNAPSWVFGHGLSYTRFSYANLRVDRPRVRAGEAVTVSVDITNSGRRQGDEVSQLYIHQRSGTASRPVRQLAGFQRVALRPGETRTLRFTLGPNELRYWNSVARDWVQDESAFDVWVGGSSAAQLGGQFEVRRD